LRACHRFWQEVAAIADNAPSDLLRAALLSEWRSEIALLYDGRPRHEVTRSLLEPVRQYGLKCDDLLAIISGLAADGRKSAEAPSLTMSAFDGRAAPWRWVVSRHAFSVWKSPR